MFQANILGAPGLCTVISTLIVGKEAAFEFVWANQFRSNTHTHCGQSAFPTLNLQLMSKTRREVPEIYNIKLSLSVQTLWIELQMDVIMIKIIHPHKAKYSD